MWLACTIYWLVTFLSVMTRSQHPAAHLLGRFESIAMTDGYGVYRALERDGPSRPPHPPHPGRDPGDTISRRRHPALRPHLICLDSDPKHSELCLATGGAAGSDGG